MFSVVVGLRSCIPIRYSIITGPVRSKCDSLNLLLSETVWRYSLHRKGWWQHTRGTVAESGRWSCNLSSPTPFAMMYTVKCAILGHHDVFSVTIDSSEPVSALKTKIKEQEPRTLGSFDTSTLKFYHVNMPLSPDTYRIVIEFISQHTIGINKRNELVELFSELSISSFRFPANTIHILVEVPGSESFSSRPGPDVTEIVWPLTTPCIVPR